MLAERKDVQAKPVSEAGVMDGVSDAFWRGLAGLNVAERNDPELHRRSGGDQAAADDELARRAEDSEGAPGHAELAVVNECGRLDLELAVDLAHRRRDVERHLPTGGVQ